MENQEYIRNIRDEALTELDGVNDLEKLNDLRIKYLGKKGQIQELMTLMKDIEGEEKRNLGAFINEIKITIVNKINELTKEIQEKEVAVKLAMEKIDISLPSTKLLVGSTHPIQRTIEEVSEIFMSMGYDLVEGPEVETDLYNFEMLNLPKGHPARDTQDSFYITDEMLLRTQTSPVQVRTMLANKEKTPIRVICPGKTYRRDNDDATHSHQFTQIEGLVVDKDISVAHLKGTLEVVIKKLFGEDRVIRFRPSYFPFTEPSLEVDVSCFNCDGKGCNICKGTGWIEILGAGMVHPNVLKMSGYDPKVYTGFAFGMGPERIAMLKYGITDIRSFYTNDIRFLDQFNRIEGGEK